MQDKIIEMLGRGIPATQVASAVGCDDSYISQLLSSPAISEQVANLRATHFSSYIALDKKVDDAEEAALSRMSSLIPFITKPSEAARIYSVLNSARRRTEDASSAQQAPAQTVIIDLPEVARVSFTMTPQKQVIEIEGRSMTTMPAKSLAARLEQRSASRLLDLKVPATLFNASQQVIDLESTSLSKKNTPLAAQL